MIILDGILSIPPDLLPLQPGLLPFPPNSISESNPDVKTRWEGAEGVFGVNQKSVDRFLLGRSLLTEIIERHDGGG